MILPKTNSSYLNLYRTGELAQRAKLAREHLSSCDLCPRECRINRLAGKNGFCRATDKARVAAFNVHHGEEPCISGTRGSGTIFFSRCNLACIFCQNYPISQIGIGREISCDELSGMMLKLQNRGCHNINFVTPTQYIPHIIEALSLAVPRGFSLPLVYNSNGYDSQAALSLLDGIVDIYLPDMKYSDSLAASSYSGVSNYPRYNRIAVFEMFRQVGLLQTDERNIARRGLIIRHLVLPRNISGSSAIFAYISQHLSPQIPVSLMTQYFPAHKAVGHPILGRSLNDEEIEHSLNKINFWKLTEGWAQETSG
jgi:putative pyruvate formate lyase activating enzyme